MQNSYIITGDFLCIQSGYGILHFFRREQDRIIYNLFAFIKTTNQNKNTQKKVRVLQMMNDH